MTKQQKTTTAYAAYIELLVSPFTSVKHIDAPSAEISRARRLIGILIDSAKIESAESILVSDAMDLYLARNRARSTSGSRQFHFNGVKEAFIPVSNARKECLSSAVFRHPAVNLAQDKFFIEESCQRISEQIKLHIVQVRLASTKGVYLCHSDILSAIMRYPNQTCYTGDMDGDLYPFADYNNSAIRNKEIDLETDWL